MVSKEQIDPLTDLDEVLSWNPPENEEPYHYPDCYPRSSFFLSGATWRGGDRSWDSLVSTSLVRSQGGDQVKTLLCHDMMGGYLEDRFTAGCEGDTADTGYTFRHWANIDYFVYFSHHFVTLPPVGWIAAARKHGVQVLGTIITEWGAGKQLLERILVSDENIERFTEVTASMCAHYGFHGWLLNIENEVEPELVDQLIKLTKSLTEAVKKKIGSEGVVLWYDSVTIKGELSWQNELNPLNKAFFDVCDGIFLNYTWTCGADKDGQSTKDSLANSISALVNDSRRTDIFVGVDVFGRGCLGGGGFQCDQALKEIRRRGLSAAIFAPGWTYEIPHRAWTEAGQASAPATQMFRSEFFVREHTFWGLLGPFLNFHGPNLQSPCESRAGADSGSDSLRFKTCFSLGLGSRTGSGGPAWYNLRKMEFQPSLVVVNEEENNDQDVLGTSLPPSCDDPRPPYTCFTSSRCSVKLDQSLCISAAKSDEAPIIVPIFIFELPLGPGESAIFLLTIKTDNEEQSDSCLQLRLGTQCGQEIKARKLSSEELFMICSDLNINTSTENENGWQRMAFSLSVTDHKLLHKIGLEIGKGESVSVFIGEFAIYKKGK